MRRTKYLISKIRERSDNTVDNDTTQGVSDTEIIECLNDAQYYLQQELEAINSEFFEREVFIASVASQEEYNIPDRVHLKQNLVQVEYSNVGTSNLSSYYTLRKRSIFERQTIDSSSFPRFYIVRGTQILLNPIPGTTVANGIRLNAITALPALDKRRGKVASSTVTNGEVTALTIDTTDFADYFTGATAFDESLVIIDDKFSIVDANGNITARNLAITSMDNSGVATFQSYTPESTSEEAAVGSYLVAGANATTHSELPIACEPYLIHWAIWQLLDRDGRYDEASKVSDRVIKLERAIKNAWERISDDLAYVPILNSDYLFA